MSSEEGAPPKLFEHCSTVFEAMKAHSKPEKLGTEHALVYEGFLTRLFQERGLATPYYTTVMRRLREMGCVRQISRGGGNSPSRWELVREPDWETFEGFEQRIHRPQTKLGQVEDATRAMAARLATVEARLDRLEDKETA